MNLNLTPVVKFSLETKTINHDICTSIQFTYNHIHNHVSECFWFLSWQDMQSVIIITICCSYDLHLDLFWNQRYNTLHLSPENWTLWQSRHLQSLNFVYICHKKQEQPKPLVLYIFFFHLLTVVLGYRNVHTKHNTKILLCKYMYEHNLPCNKNKLHIIYDNNNKDTCNNTIQISDNSWNYVCVLKTQVSAFQCWLQTYLLLFINVFV